MTDKICPMMTRPYLHHWNCNGNEDEETRIHEVYCYGINCALWVKGKENRGHCGLRS